MHNNGISSYPLCPSPSYFGSGSSSAFLTERVKSLRSAIDKNNFLKLLELYKNGYLYEGKACLLAQDSEGKTFIECEQLLLEDRIQYLEILYEIYKNHELKDTIHLREVLLKVLDSYFYEHHTIPLCKEMFNDQKFLLNYPVGQCSVRHPVQIDFVRPLEFFFADISNTVRNIIHISVEVHFAQRKMNLDDYEQKNFEQDIADLQKHVIARLMGFHERQLMRNGAHQELKALDILRAEINNSLMHEVRFIVLQKIMRCDPFGCIKRTLMHAMRFAALQKIMRCNPWEKIDRIARPIFDRYLEMKFSRDQEFEISSIKVAQEVFDICYMKGEFDYFTIKEKEQAKSAIEERIDKLYWNVLQNRESTVFQCFLQQQMPLASRMEIQDAVQSQETAIPKLPILQIQDLCKTTIPNRFKLSSLPDLLMIVQDPCTLQDQREIHEFQERLEQFKQLPTSSQTLLREIQTYLISRILNLPNQFSRFSG